MLATGADVGANEGDSVGAAGAAASLAVVAAAATEIAGVLDTSLVAAIGAVTTGDSEGVDAAAATITSFVGAIGAHNPKTSRN